MCEIHMSYQFSIYISDGRSHMLYLHRIQDPNKICDKECHTKMLLMYISLKKKKEWTGAGFQF